MHRPRVFALWWCWLLSGKRASKRRKLWRKMTRRGITVRAEKAISLIAIGVYVLLCGCGPTTTWTSEVRSPDGNWLAVARSEQGSGPGNASDATTVYLKRLKWPQPLTQVLGFSHQYATMNLKMEWVSPAHLHVRYGESAKPGDHVNLNFQVVKYAGIDISVEHLAAEA